MGRFTKRLISGLAAAAVLAGSASAQWLLTDFEAPAHRLGYYYYIYANAEVDKSYFLNQTDDPEWGQIYAPIEGEGRDASKAGGLHLSSVPLETGEAYPGWGMGISLTSADNVGFDTEHAASGSKFADVTAISFWAKTTPTNPIVAWGFKLETTQNSSSNTNPYSVYFGTGPGTAAGGYMNEHPTAPAISSSYQKYTVSLSGITPPTATGVTAPNALETRGKVGDLRQEDWHGSYYTFVPGTVTKIAWMVRGQDNAGIAGQTGLFIDDVEFIGPNFTFTAKDECADCEGELPAQNTLFSNFDDDPRSEELQAGETFNGRQNMFGWYWYHYQDTYGAAVTGDLDYDEDAGEDVLVLDGNGFNDSKGLRLTFSVSGSAPPAGETPFVGIGTNLYDADNADALSWVRGEFLNASDITGIFFRYKTKDITSGIVVEVQDMTDAKNAYDDADDGQVFYTKLPASTAWRTALIPWSKLVLPSWITPTSGHRRSTNMTLDKTALAKIQFKYDGTVNGEFQIDDVYFFGGNVNVRNVSSRAARTAGLRASYNRGVVGVNLNSASAIASGKISLVNTKGRVVASAPLKTTGGRVTANLGNGRIPTGMYFVRVDARDMSGKRVVQQAPLSIVK